jgi:hypothetical protein
LETMLRAILPYRSEIAKVLSPAVLHKMIHT